MENKNSFVAHSRNMNYNQRSDRFGFIARVYKHLFGAVIIVVILEFLLFLAGIAQPISEKMLQAPWLLILAGFICSVGLPGE